jgi:hypothetical protein
MNSRRTMLAVVFSLVLVLSALPAVAATFQGDFSINRFGTAGSSFRNLTPSATTFCYLSRVVIGETDGAPDSAGCRLTRGNFRWTLEAVLNLTSTSAEARCTAMCYAD